MNRQNGFSLVVLSSLSVAAVLTLAQPTSGQEQRTKSPSPPQARPAAPPQAQPAPRPTAPPAPGVDAANIKIFRAGGAQPTLRKLPQPPGNPPADLSVSDLAASVKAIFGYTSPEKLLHVRLTPLHGYEA